MDLDQFRLRRGGRFLRFADCLGRCGPGTKQRVTTGLSRRRGVLGHRFCLCRLGGFLRQLGFRNLGLGLLKLRRRCCLDVGLVRSGFLDGVGRRLGRGEVGLDIRLRALALFGLGKFRRFGLVGKLGLEIHRDDVGLFGFFGRFSHFAVWAFFNLPDVSLDRLGYSGLRLSHLRFGLCLRLTVGDRGRFVATVGFSGFSGFIAATGSRRSRGRRGTCRRNGRQFLLRLRLRDFVGFAGPTSAQQRRILTALGGQNDVDHRADEDERGRERVDPDASDVRRGVVAQQLHPESADAVQRDVGREQSPVAEDETSVQQQQEAENQQIPEQFVEERGLHDERHLPRRDAVERVHVDVSGRVAPVEDLQAPGHRRFAAVEFLIEVVPEPSDGLRQHHSRRHRIDERGQRDAVPPAADPRAHDPERHGTPDAQAAVPDAQRRTQARTTGTPVGLPVRGQVVEAAADQTERHHPEGDVVDDTPLAAAGRPAPVPDQQSDDDAGDDEERIGTDGQRSQMPDAPRRAGNVGEEPRRHADFLWRTPAASSSVSARRAGKPSPNAETSADPTITPSA